MSQNGNDIPWTERVRTRGLGGAARQSFDEVKGGINVFDEATKGKRGMAFARIGAVGAGTALALHALKDRTDDGKERSALVRLGEGVLGVGLAAGGVFAGRA